MPKIPNWTPTSNVSTTSGKSDMAWKNDNTGEIVVVEDTNPGRYDILLNKNKRIFKSRLGSKNTKEDARKWAVKWMRDNPRT